MDITLQTLEANDAIMIIDIDFFKKINDRFGHDVGDACLRETSAFLSQCFSPTHPVARIGGEEFAVFLAKPAVSELKEIASNISQGFRFKVDASTSCHISASVGIAQWQVPMERANVLRLADQAVYRAKAAGRAGYVLLRGDDASEPTGDYVIS
ncbi:GGDEF domain-containing protein [Algirhabdus cladophorae]|uniref:GGDEF domain-containing protein n=1 Tax=Algirhabdus cladophorae TaxID=3377108 RepID=UPI003B847EFE